MKNTSSVNRGTATACIGLLNELAIDSTQVNANADLDSLTPRFAVEARAAIQAYLATLFAEEESQQEPQTAQTEVVASPPEVTSSEVVTSTVPLALPVVLPQAEHEELASENAARHDWIAQQGRQQREVHSHDLRTSDFKVSTTDPDATAMRLKGEGRIWAIIPTTSSMAAKPALSSRCWSRRKRVMDNQPMRDLIFRTRIRREPAASPHDGGYQVWHHREHPSPGRCRHARLCSAAELGRAI